MVGTKQWVIAFAFAVCATGPARADWKVYLSGELGYSVLDSSVSGQAVLNTTPASIVRLRGSDTDVSPLVGGALGISSPMNEVVPSNLPFGWRLPDWPVRFELEAVGLREYDLRTRGIQPPGSGPLQTKVETYSVMTNFGFDVPLRGLYRPISWTTARLFGRWRLRTLKHVLDRMSWDNVVGIGFAYLDARTEEGGVDSKGDAYNFAWQAGTGLGYQLTDRVNLGLGYRYIDVGKVDYSLDGSALQDGSRFKLDSEIHEARARIRFDFYNFPAPWR